LSGLSKTKPEKRESISSGGEYMAGGPGHPPIAFRAKIKRKLCGWAAEWKQERSMSTSASLEASDNAGRFQAMLRSLHEFDKAEVFGVVTTLLSVQDEDSTYLGTYFRARGNVETLLVFDNAKHFQAVAMLARSLFELAVDIKLLEIIPLGYLKMIMAAQAERLRCARKAIQFKKSHPDANLEIDPQLAFVAKDAAEIERKHGILWPGVKRVEHWSGRNLKERVALLKEPFEQIYETEYPQLSWQAHPGLTGVANLKAETFVFMCSWGFKLAVDAYWEILSTIIHKYKISLVDEKIGLKMKAAKMLPFTDNSGQAEQLIRALLG
jgi:hypothetical protein